MDTEEIHRLMNADCGVKFGTGTAEATYKSSPLFQYRSTHSRNLIALPVNKSEKPSVRRKLARRQA
eukprot:5442879-Amphidinium_carterae.6